ncbi:MAG: hypothetical protein KF767_18745 [Bdellovibrionaceae bacterium]|nr:hypothetical protein [Pseudobdellovibrionaceae bacterium]
MESTSNLPDPEDALPFFRLMISAVGTALALFLLIGIDPEEFMQDESWTEYFKAYGAYLCLVGLSVFMTYRYFPRRWVAPEGLNASTKFRQRLAATLIFAVLTGYGGVFAYIRFVESTYATVTADCVRKPSSTLFQCEFVAYGEKRKLRSPVFLVQDIERIEYLEDQSIELVTTTSKIAFPSGHMDEVSIRLSKQLQTDPNAQRTRWEYRFDKGQPKIQFPRQPASESQ